MASKTSRKGKLTPSDVFALNLKGLMAIKGVSVGEMHEYMGISATTFYKRLNRPYEFTMSDVESAAKKLGVSASAMLAGVMEVSASA